MKNSVFRFFFVFGVLSVLTGASAFACEVGSCADGESLTLNPPIFEGYSQEEMEQGRKIIENYRKLFEDSEEDKDFGSSLGGDGCHASDEDLIL